jgi:hypothetical protein
MTLYNTVPPRGQEGVPDDWFKWNLFPYSLSHEAMKWYSFVSFEVEGNWDQLIKKSCDKFFPIIKVQHIRMQVINFKQGEEGIDQAWYRFNELVEQGPRLRFPGDVLLHKFFFSLTLSCMEYIQMCAGGGSCGENTHKSYPTSKKINKAVVMQRDWETRLSGKPRCDTSVKPLAGREERGSNPEKVEEVKHAEARTVPESDHAETSKVSERTMSRAKPLREFEQIDWVPIDFGDIFDKRKLFPNQKGMAKAVEMDFLPEKHVEQPYNLETTGEVLQKLFSKEEVDPDLVAEAKRITGIKPEVSPFARLAEIYAIGSSEEEKTSSRIDCKVNNIDCKALCDIGAQVSVLSPKFFDEIHDHTIDLVPTTSKLLTQKIGIGKRLTCGPSLVGEHHSARSFPQSIR